MRLRAYQIRRVFADIQLNVTFKSLTLGLNL
jgi:hypothetical protein